MAAPSDLVAVLLGDTSPAPADAVALDAALRDAWEAGRRAWPGVDLDAETFVAHLARHAAAARTAADLATIRAADLYLACACCRGDPRAMAAFQRAFIANVPIFASQRRARPGLVEDFKQMLAERLLVAAGTEPPRIAGYSGRGSLAGWVRVAAARLAMNLQEATLQHDPLEAPDTLAALVAAPDPELAILKARYAREFKDAFEAALGELSPQERNVLRFHFLQGLTGDRMAAIYDVSRRTVHRWIEDARASVLDRTRRALAARLSLSAHELDSLMQLLRSDLGSAIVRHLGDAHPETRRGGK